jgi:hypothetical protein
MAGLGRKFGTANMKQSIYDLTSPGHIKYEFLNKYYRQAGAAWRVVSSHDN